jgi:hypothetical protein
MFYVFKIFVVFYFFALRPGGRENATLSGCKKVTKKIKAVMHDAKNGLRYAKMPKLAFSLCCNRYSLVCSSSGHLFADLFIFIIGAHEGYAVFNASLHPFF